MHQIFLKNGSTYQYSPSALIEERIIDFNQLLYNKGIKNLCQRPFLGMNQKNKGVLEFDSVFEGANLDAVIEQEPNQYELYMRIDSNTKGHMQWFYFKVKKSNVNVRCKFSICNFTKKRSLFQQGMKPYVRSHQTQGWIQSGENVTYQEGNELKAFIESNRKYYTLSFEYQFHEYEDEIEFASCIPYTFSQLNNFIQEINSPYLKKDILTKTLSGIEVPYLIFEDQKSNIPKQDKNLVIISGRVHPGESNSSWIAQGILEELLKESSKTFLQGNVVFFVPMINPDGVILGNYRSSFAGKDLNRQYKFSNEKMYPTVQALKNLFTQKLSIYRGKYTIYLDLHGHSLKKNSFSYGPKFEQCSKNYFRTRFLPQLWDKDNNVFRFQSCRFSPGINKSGAARNFFTKDFKLVYCYTIETSFFGYQEREQTKYFRKDGFKDLGRTLYNGVKQFQELNEGYEKFLSVKQNKKKKSTGNKKYESSGIKTQSAPGKERSDFHRYYEDFIQKVENLENQNSDENENSDEQQDCKSDSEDSIEDYHGCEYQYIKQKINLNRLIFNEMSRGGEINILAQVYVKRLEVLEQDKINGLMEEQRQLKKESRRNYLEVKKEEISIKKKLKNVSYDQSRKKYSIEENKPIIRAQPYITFQPDFPTYQNFRINSRDQRQRTSFSVKKRGDLYENPKQKKLLLPIFKPKQTDYTIKVLDLIIPERPRNLKIKSEQRILTKPKKEEN